VPSQKFTTVAAVAAPDYITRRANNWTPFIHRITSNHLLASNYIHKKAASHPPSQPAISPSSSRALNRMGGHGWSLFNLHHPPLYCPTQ